MGGGVPEPIGAERVDRWFFDQVATSDLINVQASIDPYRKVVFWRLSATQLLGFAWALNAGAGAWFTATIETSALTFIATPGLLADDWDVVADDNDVLMDSRAFEGGQPVFAALNENLKYATFTGIPLPHTLRGSILNNPNSGIGSWITPISKGAGLGYRVYTADNLDNTLTLASSGTKARNGAVPLRYRGMNIQFEEFEDAGADWEFSHGLDYGRTSQGGPR